MVQTQPLQQRTSDSTAEKPLRASSKGCRVRIAEPEEPLSGSWQKLDFATDAGSSAPSLPPSLFSPSSCGSWGELPIQQFFFVSTMQIAEWSTLHFPF